VSKVHKLGRRKTGARKVRGQGSLASLAAEHRRELKAWILANSMPENGHNLTASGIIEHISRTYHIEVLFFIFYFLLFFIFLFIFLLTIRNSDQSVLFEDSVEADQDQVHARWSGRIRSEGPSSVDAAPPRALYSAGSGSGAAERRGLADARRVKYDCQSVPAKGVLRGRKAPN
jgi:hypothetical protein